MYFEDYEYRKHKQYRSSNSLGRMEVITVIEQVYGYMSINQLLYGCVTCYDVTYFLSRPARSTLLISDPIYHDSTSPTLLQSIFYFVHLVETGGNALDASPDEPNFPLFPVNIDQQNQDIYENLQPYTDSNVSTDPENESDSTYSNSNISLFTLKDIQEAIYIGEGATGPVFRLRNKDIVVKNCDSFNNPKGLKMFKNEVKIYEKLSLLNLDCVPCYYGFKDYFGQLFMALDFIDGRHYDLKKDPIFKPKLDNAVEKLKRVGIIHNDLKPDNIILNLDGDIKIIDFGLAEIL
jgi:predicted Ser/Thr protein kinase